MNRGKWICVLLVIFLPGCFSRTNWWKDEVKLPTGLWTRYSEEPLSLKQRDEVENAFLKCGFPLPGEFSIFPQEVLSKMGIDKVKDSKKMDAAYAELYYCMKNAGFPTHALRDPCPNSDYPVCQPGAVIPTPSIKNKLNSPFCKLYPKAIICQPDYDPTGSIQLQK